MSELAATRQSILENVAHDWKPREIRGLAASLLRLADAIEQDWSPPTTRSIFQWPTNLRQIERDAGNLAIKARVIVQTRANRTKYIDPDLLGEPAWDMLLDLFMQFAGGARVSVTSLCIASRVPATTALRYVSLLEDKGYIKKLPSEHDRRVSLLSLSDKGILAMGNLLNNYEA